MKALNRSVFLLWAVLCLPVAIVAGDHATFARSGIIQATATVSNPFGFANNAAGGSWSDEPVWVIRHPRPDGVVIQVEADGDMVGQFSLESASFDYRSLPAPMGQSKHLSFVDPQVVLRSVPAATDTCLVTIICPEN